jgi:prevent-host-death family protein
MKNVILAEPPKDGESTVGIRELKAKLSQYLRRIKSGESLGVTERGELVAFLVPAASDPVRERLSALVREGAARWNGGKPEGSKSPVKTQGRPVSDIVLEDRR